MTKTTATERRTLPVEFEVRAARPDGSIPVRGYAAVFGAQSENLGGFIETIAPGAFKKTIRESDVRLLQNHNEDLVLARTKSGTLRLSEDSTGLHVEADMAPTSYANDLAILMRRGDINQMSFMFQAIKDSWDERGALPQRTLHEVRLYDTSIVTFPAYPAASVTLRSQQLDGILSLFGIDQLPEEERNEFIERLVRRELNPRHFTVLRSFRTKIEELEHEATKELPEGVDPAAVERLRREAERAGLESRFNPNQPRDKDGKWTSGGGGGAAMSAAGAGDASGDAGPGLAPEVADKIPGLARRIAQTARDAEPEMTRRMQELAETFGGKMAGLEFRLKKIDGIERKIAEKMEENPGVDPESASKLVGDALRYTMLGTPENYVSMANAVINEMDAQGYDAKVKNSWQEGNNYMGVNTVLTRREDGFKVELQFHTEDSIRIKEEAHKAYEVYRVSEDPAERARLNQEMIDMWQGIEFPAGIENLGTVVSKRLWDVFVERRRRR